MEKTDTARQERSFNRDQLDHLKECLDWNPNLADAMTVFLTGFSEMSAYELADVWLRFALKIKADPKYIENTFPND